MRAVYFDCFMGASGDMIISALVDAGLDESFYTDLLKKLHLDDKLKLFFQKVSKCGIRATALRIESRDEKDERNFEEVAGIIEGGSLPASLKEQALLILQKIAEAEARVHGVELEDVHFHEIGGLDSVFDIVGAVAGLEELGVERVYSSPLPVSHGQVKCHHGVLPVPAPATTEILRGVPVRHVDIEGETLTPTGAAIITTLACEYSLPGMKVEEIGYGAGMRDFENVPNVLRVVVGEVEEEFLSDEIVVMETNIDNVNPQVYDLLIQRLFEAGALDVFVTPVYMKKTRPGVVLTVLGNVDAQEKLARIIFEEIPTLGIRLERRRRIKLARESVSVQTPFGDVRVKIGKKGDKILHIEPEYDDCRKMAEEKGVPFMRVYGLVKRAAYERLKDSQD